MMGDFLQLRGYKITKFTLRALHCCAEDYIPPSKAVILHCGEFLTEGG